MKEHTVDFTSPEQLAELLETIGLRLHAKNRIAGGESGYLWHLAEVLRAAGRLAARLDFEHDEMYALFGNGYEAGTVPAEDQQDHFLGLLREAAKPV